MTERPDRDRRGRLRVDFGEGEDRVTVRPDGSSGGGRPGAGTDDVVLRSAALLWQGEREPIPHQGFWLDSREGHLLSGAVGRAPARIEETLDGHVLVAQAGQGAVYLNGEPLLEGERRPLAQGDALAVGSNLAHYLPAGGAPARLPSIAPVEAGRLRASSEELILGRDEECDLVLDYPTVSRRHAVIRSHSGQTTIEDAGSATGVRVNGIPIRRTDLEVGDEIAIGPYRIVFDGEELVERAAPADGLPIHARGVTVSFGDLNILKPTNLHLRAGELVALIGESGAGKTTLLKTLAGVSSPSGGEILCGGEPVRQRLSEIGYVPQFDLVHGQLSVYEALDYAARLRLPSDTSAAERHARVTEVIAQLGLTERTHIRVERLSGGQRKRVSVGIELLHRPGAVFLDEPTTGLDPGLERMMMDLFRQIADSGKTVSLVTHATGSLELCDRVIVMGRGGIKRFDGTPDELLSAFEADSFDQVYARMAEGFTPPPPEDTLSAPEAADSAAARAHRQNRQSFIYQARVLAGRYVTLMTRDRQNLISLAVQTLILALITAIIFDPDVFRWPSEDADVKSFTAKAAQLVFLTVTISIWLGSIASAREIIKEKPVVAREYAVGVSIRAYLTSKLVVLLTLVTAQVLLYGMIVLLLRQVDRGVLPLLLTMVAAAWIAVILGLVVSASARSEDQATGLIPILLIPQLLFGGALVTVPELDDSSTVGHVLTYTVPSRWAYEAAGTAVGMADRIMAPSSDESQRGVQLAYGFVSNETLKKREKAEREEAIQKQTRARSPGAQRAPPEKKTKKPPLKRQAGYFFNLGFGQFLVIAALFFSALYLLLWLLVRRGLSTAE